MYQQLVTPKLSTSGPAGWCLWFVEEDYGLAHIGASAEAAWSATHHPHSLDQPPNAIVPVYWTYFDSSVNIEFGHIAIWVPGRGIFSSPFNVSNGNQWFGSIQEVTNRINQIRNANAHYLGWSEDLAGVQLIKQGEEMLSTPEVVQVYKLAFDDDDKDVPQNIKDAFTGKPVAELVNYLIQDASYQKHKAEVNNPSGYKPYAGPQLFVKS